MNDQPYLDSNLLMPPDQASFVDRLEPPRLTEQQLQQQHQANLNANMMRYMRNSNSNKVYQKIVRKMSPSNGNIYSSRRWGDQR